MTINTLILGMLILNILVPLGTIRLYCINSKGVEFNHLLIFTFGYLFYWILPIGVGINRVFEAEPAMRLWYQVFDAVPPKTIALYLTVALGCYLSFVAGTVLTTHLFQPRVVYKKIFFYPRLLDIMLLLGLLLAGTYAFLLRNELFHGYTAIEAGEGAEKRGPFIAASVFLLSLALIFAAKKHEDSGFKASFGQLLRNRYFVCYFVVAFLVLSTGGRLYFLSSLVMLLVYRTVYFARFSSRAAFTVIGGAGLLAGLVGLLRLNGAVDLQGALLNVFVEPLFTSFSLIHFLGNSDIEWVKFPIFLLSSFVNLVPTALLPDKARLILVPDDYGYVSFAPVGALNSYFSFMINFGLLGTAAFLFLFSFLLNYLKLRDGRLLFRVIYVMLCGWLGFTFFRDAFFISIVKSMFQFSVLTPILIVLLLQLLSVKLRSASGQSGEAALSQAATGKIQ